MTLGQSERGVATLTTTLLLLFVMTLVVGVANRNLIFEQRSSANQLRSTRAFEAAEAGLEWALAMLNSDTTIDANCAPSAAPGGTSFRRRFVNYDAASRNFTPRAWSDAGSIVPLQAACVRTDGGWSCSCPSSGHPTLAAPPDGGSHPAFALRFVAAGRAGTLNVVATGCDQFAPACLPGLAGAPRGAASAQVQITLGLLPALASLPAAALTARGDIMAGGTLSLANTDVASGGLTAQAGGSVALANADLATVPGAPAASSIAAQDGDLATLDTPRMISRFLGLDRNRWLSLPGAHSLSCPVDCTRALVETLGTDIDRPMLWITNDLQLEGPLTVGSPQRPVLLVVDGQIRLAGGVHVHGTIISLAATWDSTGTANAAIHGALISAGSVIGDGTPSVVYDAGVLARLHGEFGTFARVPGSWRDF